MKPNRTRCCWNLFFAFAGWFALPAAAQPTTDPVLFNIGSTPIHRSEFEYIYTKTNGEKADFSKASLEEYLELYINFKLKVQRARDMKLDTVVALRQELAGYRQQLANNYLMDRQVLDRLMREAYDRSLQDVSISHLMVLIDPNAAPADTLAAYTKIMGYRKKCEQGTRFDELAAQHSEDPSAKTNRGLIGYFTALQLPGFYNVETAAYATPVGKLSQPVRTSVGYHLVMVNDKRPARGQIEVAHILVRTTDPTSEAEAQAKINKVYNELLKGEDFGKLANLYSEDENTAPSNGYLGFFGINRYEAAFEEAAFALKNDGDYSRPFRSSVGWHILKRISRPAPAPYEDMKKTLKVKIKSDSRYDIARQKLVEQIKKEAQYKEYPEAKKAILDQLDNSFLSSKWELPTKNTDMVIAELGGRKVLNSEFIAFLNKNAGQRVSGGRTADKAVVFEKMFESFVEKNCIQFEENRLENKYPEFKALMREYEEGIILFEATKLLIWDKAAQDSIGLDGFYKANKAKYAWGERVEALLVSMPADKPEVVETAKKLLKTQSVEDVETKIASGDDGFMEVREGVYEKGQNKLVDNTIWKKGTVGETTIEGDVAVFVIIKEVIKPRPKTLAEARGYVVADYQDALEKNWIATLRKDYQLKVNREVFEAMIKP